LITFSHINHSSSFPEERNVSKGKYCAAGFLILLVSAGASAAPAAWLPNAPRDKDYYDGGNPSPAKVHLGAQLFFDKILSGNLNTSCATCHHPLTDTGDGLSLSVGEGGRGLGVTRDTGAGPDIVPERVPRNAPPLFNLGARQFEKMFHDGRVETDPGQPSGFRSPAGNDLPAGLDNVLAAQAMFPVTSGTEMAGQYGENPIANAAAFGNLHDVWRQLAERLQNIDGPGGYVEQFVDVFDDIAEASDITFVHAANAIAAFEAVSWRADNSPFDRFLRGDWTAMSASARRGMRVFYSPGKANCGRCHSGSFQTNHDFHSIATPQIGPGKGDGVSGNQDFGRERATGNRADRFRFRVPSLRNVALTAPYGHSGAYDTLESMVRHHLDTTRSLYNYNPEQAVLPLHPDPSVARADLLVMRDPQLVGQIAASSELGPASISAREFSELMEFLAALTDPSSIDLRRDVPHSLPSGLPLAE
jgi:cytochrome c peroxidase